MENNEMLDRYWARIKAAEQTLTKDIECWCSPKNGVPSFGGDTLIPFHIEQFKIFSEKALHLYGIQVNGEKPQVNDEEPQANGKGTESERADFRNLVVGLLTARWFLLRQTALQRIPGSPYEESIAKLDERTRKSYFRVRRALESLTDSKTASGMLLFAPSVYLGSLASITVFNRNTPIILSVPIAAAYEIQKDPPDNEGPSVLAIDHEIGHSVLLQFPQFVEDVKQLLEEIWGTSELDTVPRKTQSLRRQMLGWCEEVLADMIGTTLSGMNYLVSALDVMATSEVSLGITDDVHPPSPVRAYVHAEVLRFLREEIRDIAAQQKAGTIVEGTRDLRDAEEILSATEESIRSSLRLAMEQADQPAPLSIINPTFSPHLHHQFQSTSSVVAFITLSDVQLQLVDMVDIILNDARPSLLHGKTVGEFLVKCFMLADKPVVETAETWAQITQDAEEFALEFEWPLETFVAGSRRNGILDIIFGGKGD